jgi:hypothetical protein
MFENLGILYQGLEIQMRFKRAGRKQSISVTTIWIYRSKTVYQAGEQQ